MNAEKLKKALEWYGVASQNSHVETLLMLEYRRYLSGSKYPDVLMYRVSILLAAVLLNYSQEYFKENTILGLCSSAVKFGPVFTREEAVAVLDVPVLNTETLPAKLTAALRLAALEDASC